MEENQKKTKLKSSRRPGEYKRKSAEPTEEHKNPIVRFLARTGYTVWLIVLGVGIVIAFIVSVALL
ncbi:hypothetical protein [Christiangramia portivictoriae]|uniref:hypothetical protein n=1 Tax=Christiangramia portivictoriae TaxID=326069 RepID=UPI000414A1A1|nr:hypothetical protein [Christiangramia portivictoriae]